MWALANTPRIPRAAICCFSVSLNIGGTCSTRSGLSSNLDQTRRGRTRSTSLDIRRSSSKFFVAEAPPVHDTVDAKLMYAGTAGREKKKKKKKRESEANKKNMKRPLLALTAVNQTPPYKHTPARGSLTLPSPADPSTRPSSPPSPSSASNPGSPPARSRPPPTQRPRRPPRRRRRLPPRAHRPWRWRRQRHPAPAKREPARRGAVMERDRTVRTATEW